jgi:hypothetical protein
MAESMVRAMHLSNMPEEAGVSRNHGHLRVETEKTLMITLL